MLEIFEVYEYDVTHYDPQTGQGGLFVGYINTFLKLKTDASDYPSWARTLEGEDRYVDAFYASEGMRLDILDKTQRCKTGSGQTVSQFNVGQAH